MALAGTEILQVVPIQANGQPSVVPLQTTTSQIAALAAASLTLNPTAGITAGTTRTQAGATAVSIGVNRVDTSTAPSAGSLLGDGVRLPAAAAGALVVIINNTANPIQVYGNGSDTVNGIAAATGIAVPPNSLDAYYAASTGQWQVEAGVGYAGQLNTVLALDAITAAGTTQGAGTALTADFNRVTTAANTTAPFNGVVLPTGKPGLDIYVINDAGNSIQVYGSGTDTVDGQTAATGVTQMTGSLCLYTYVSSAAGWRTEGLGTGYAGSFQTFSYVDGLSANSGGVQAGATAITAMQNRFTTVGGAGYSAVLPTGVAGMNLTVINAGANYMNVFPASGQTINGQAANAAFILTPNSVVEFFTTLAGAWHTVTYSNVPQPVAYVANSTVGSTTLTAANVAGGTNTTVPTEVDLNLTGTQTGAATATLPTVAALVAAIPNAIAGQTYKLRVINSSSGAYTWTIGTNTGWTLNGTMTVAQNTWRDFVVTFTSLSAATLQSVGTGTYS